MTPLYETVLRQVEALSEAEQLKLIAQITERLHGHTSPVAPASILDLQGLGRDVWRGQDAQDYVGHERSSWNG